MSRKSKQKAGLTNAARKSLQIEEKLNEQVEKWREKLLNLGNRNSLINTSFSPSRGVSFVLDGPPGTGKSQTIANIIADALADGRRVLFVSEKVPALEVVKRRLDACGLGDFCLECHSSKASRKALVHELSRCLDIRAEVYDDATPRLDEAKQKRDKLNEYVRSIHRPRHPLGRSLYEIYGKIARLSRLGVAKHSRCVLPDLSGIASESIAHWLRIVGRAEELSGVIENYSEHPWRGSIVTSRPLSLIDDIQDHFGTLSKAFSDIDEATRPLVVTQMLDGDVTPKSLSEVQASLKRGLAAPCIPQSWFGNPLVVAEALLQRHAAKCEIDELQPKLVDYVDDVADRFQADESTLWNDRRSDSWASRLTKPLPPLARDQRSILDGHASTLRRTAAHCADAEAKLASLVDALALPILLDVPMSEILKVVKLARVVAESVPLLPGWFESNNWTRLRLRCNEALQQLSIADQAVAQTHGRIATESLEQLANEVKDVDAIEKAWSIVRRSYTEEMANDPNLIVEAASNAAEALSIADQAAREICGVLQIPDDCQISLPVASQLSESLGAIAGAGTIHGAWADLNTRKNVQRACEAAVEDLTEAERIRGILTTRMTHRAFEHSSASLAHGSVRFESFWHRRFGGFGDFRRRAADLYRQPLPDTLLDTLEREDEKLGKVCEEISAISDAAKTCLQVRSRTAVHYCTEAPNIDVLLADLRHAGRFRDAHSTAATLFEQEKDLMPHGLVAADRACWERALSGVEAATRLCRMVNRPDALRESLCAESCVDTNLLIVAADNTEVAFQKLNAALVESTDAIVLSPPSEPEIDVQRRPLKTLQEHIESASQEFASRAELLGRVTDLLLVGTDVPIDRLPVRQRGFRFSTCREVPGAKHR